MELLRVSYRLEGEDDAGAARERAEAIALEQTVEVPRSVVRDPWIEEQVMGRVEAVRPAAEGGHLATIAYPVAVTGLEPAQLLNVVFGNSSLQEDLRCVDLDLPPSLLAALEGPRFGIEGLRKLTGVYQRPLTCTAVKPMGQSSQALAELCGTFARAGIDVIKDDHGLGDQAFHPFEERVPVCLDAARRAADETGHAALYVPNLLGTPDRVKRQLDFAQEAGARAVMVSPMLIGLPAFWELCHHHAEVPVLAHPAFAGAQRIAPEALFGKLFRLFGADAVIYVNFASRFSPSPEACRELAARLLGSWGGLLPSLPVPAGGIRVESVAEVVAFYGNDAMLLIGGDLQVGGEPEERSRLFVESVREAAARAAAI